MSESLSAVELITPSNPSIADEANWSGDITHVSLKTVKAAMLDFTSKRVLMLALTLLCIAAFANSVTGDFVRDDTQQIASNPMLGHWDEALSQFEHITVLTPDRAISYFKGKIYFSEVGRI